MALPSGFKTLREVITYGVGVGIVVFGLVGERDPQPSVITVGIGVLLAPAILASDEKRSK